MVRYKETQGNVVVERAYKRLYEEYLRLAHDMQATANNVLAPENKENGPMLNALMSITDFEKHLISQERIAVIRALEKCLGIEGTLFTSGEEAN